MASQRVEWMLEQIDKWNAGDVEGFLDAAPSGFEFTPDPSFPDAGTYSGEEWRDWIREWARTWEQSRLEVLDISEYAQAVVVESRWHLIAHQTGGAVPLSDFNIVLWFEGDQPTRMAAFFDRERAVAAASRGPG